jgi:hypothetical protein
MASQCLYNMDGRILDYHEPAGDWRSELALRFSCVLSGAVVFAVVTVAMFVASIYLHAPDLLGLYPIAFTFAVMAAVAEGKWTRFVGMGAVAGSVLMSTVGYGACLFIMVRPGP